MDAYQAWAIQIQKKDAEKWLFLTNGTKNPSDIAVSERPASAKIYRRKLRAQFMVDQINATVRYKAKLIELKVNGAITPIDS